MRSAIFLVSFFAISAIAHWGLWRWLGRVAPGWRAAQRRIVLPAFFVLMLLPFARPLASRYPETPLRAVVALGMVWQFTVLISMLLLSLGQIVVMLATWRRREVEVPREAPPVPRPDSVDRRALIEGIAGGAILTGIGGSLAWGALRGRYDWQVEEVAIRLARLPKALDGFTIVQVSDLHVGAFIDERELLAGLARVQALRPDLVAITGDIIDFDARYVPLAARHLGGLAARYGSVCIPGNHDHYTGVDEVLGGMRKAGIDVLLNRAKTIAAGDGGGIAILGVDDLASRRRGPAMGPNLAAAMATVPADSPKVLLAHQPPFVEEASRAGIDLQLSGHTHGGQINFGLRPIDFVTPYVAGRYQVGATTLYVNRGFGTAGPPSRVGAPPEITKIVLVAG